MPPRPGQDRYMPLLAGRLLSAAVLVALAVSGAVFLLSRGGAAQDRAPSPVAGAAVRRPGSPTRTGAPARPGVHARPAASARGNGPVVRLSSDQLAGQRIIYAYAGLRPPASLLAAIRDGEAAGVIFFANNV
ncbi:MAG: hypothetical protein ABI355_00730, partial [Solirubrobacteraceae bacterium]